MESPQAVSDTNSLLLDDGIDGSTYGTPTESATMTTRTGADKDPQLVVGAARSLKNMFVDLMSVLEAQAKSKIFIQGDITLRVEGRESYTITLFNEDSVEPSDLKVRIGNVPATNGGSHETPQKRGPECVDSDEATSPSKRARIDDTTKELEDVEEEATEEAPDTSTVSSKLNNISAQIKWVEECRRIAGELHDAREEKWRTTSATFHDDNRKARENHEKFLLAEMNWQRSMLIALANDMKGMQALSHSLKWETPPTPFPGPQQTQQPIPAPALPMPQLKHRPYAPRQMQKKKKMPATAPTDSPAHAKEPT